VREATSLWLGCLPQCPAAVLSPYPELHADSNLSFLEGTSHVEELVLRARERGYEAAIPPERHGAPTPRAAPPLARQCETERSPCLLDRSSSSCLASPQAPGTPGGGG